MNFKSDPWDIHFQELEAALEEALGAAPGSYPMGYHVLNLLRESLDCLPDLMQDEELRLGFLQRTGSWFLVSRPSVDWNWETSCLASSNSMEKLAAFAGLSKGMAWVIQDGIKRPALFHRLHKLAPFPSAPQEVPCGSTEFIGNELLFMEPWAARGEDDEPWAFLPRTLCLGCDKPVFHPREGNTFEACLSRHLGLETWPEIHFQGETLGRSWELYFQILPNGLEIDEDQHEAHFIFEISPIWFSSGTSVNAQEAVSTWRSEDWKHLVCLVQEELLDAMHQLIGRRKIKASTSSDALHTRVDLVEPSFRLASWASRYTRLSTLAGTQIKLLGRPAPNFSKAQNLMRAEERRLQEGLAVLAQTGEAPDWIQAKRSKNGGFELNKAERVLIRKRLGREKEGFVELDSGGRPRWVKLITLLNGEEREFHLGGQWPYLHRPARLALEKSLRVEELQLLERDQALSQEMELILFKEVSEEERVLTRKLLERVQRRKEELTSWGRAMWLLKCILDQQAAQGTNPIEVDAQAIKDWLWPTQEAPENWLQATRETLWLLLQISAAVTGEAGEIAGGSLIDVKTQRKDSPGRYLAEEEAKRLKGSNLVYIIRVHEALLGATALLKTGQRMLRSGVEAEIFETGKLNPKQIREVRTTGDHFEHREAHLAVYLKALGFGEVEIALAEFLAAHITLAGSSMRGNWTSKPKFGRFPDGSSQRQYTSEFCPLIPKDLVVHAALGNYKCRAEQGWNMAGKPQESRRSKGGLLGHMSLDLPPGAAEDRRKVIYLQGLQILRRVVLELGRGLLAVRVGTDWYNLGEALEDAALLHLLQVGKIFPFFAPDWLEMVRTSYEQRTGVKLTPSVSEAERIRWTKSPTPTLDGLPLHVQLESFLERHSFTQAQAAEALGVSKMAVSQWLKGPGIKGGKAISPASAEKIQKWIEESE